MLFFAAWAKVGAAICAVIVPSDTLTQLITQGGTSALIVFLLMALSKALKKLEAREARLDLMHDKEVENHAASAVASEKLSVAIDNLTKAVAKDEN